MSWVEAANDPLVLKAWQDALGETRPRAVGSAVIIIRRDPDQVVFSVRGRGFELLRIAMTAELFMDLILSKGHNPACPDAQCDPLYEALLRQLQRGP